jgi:nucleotide-binding universal stress UspA family protein
MKILLAVDGSRHSLKAVKRLIEQADWYREIPQVELVNVHLPVPRLPRMNMVVGASQIRRYYDKEGNAALAGARKLLDRSGIPYAARLLVGPIAETLIKHAKLTRCDLIMVGTRGLTAASNLLLGSIAQKLAHISPVPILLVK